MTTVLTERRQHIKIQRVRSCAEGDRDGSDVAASQGTPVFATSHQNLERSQEGFFPKASAEQHGPADTLRFQTLSHQACDRIHFCCFKPSGL